MSLHISISKMFKGKLSNFFHRISWEVSSPYTKNNSKEIPLQQFKCSCYDDLRFFIIMIVIISAGKGNRAMGAFAKHDYTKKVIELIIREALLYQRDVSVFFN